MKTNLTSKQIRKMFLDFYETKGHEIIPSQSLVPNNDPTLLWINSGVATMKPYFDGRIVPKNPKMASSQKSIRTNDIDNVGITKRHHTLFEMLGNFSIGDYFKKETIEYAWEFLTDKKWMGLDSNKLYVTVYPDDTETADIWKNTIGLTAEQIVPFEDNFWEIGVGPSGPCTEIFYDRGEKYNLDTPKEELVVGGENERYLEIWNLVFSMYNADPTLDRKDYELLPNKNIDTGMGLERLVSILQNAESNYETDLFMPIIDAISKLTNKKYNTNNTEETQAFRVIADHVRAVTLAIADGVLPSNEGRGYILRRLIRRAVNFSRTLGLNKSFLNELVDDVISILGDFYTNIEPKKQFIKDIIKKEEERFLNTLSDGLKLVNDVIGELKSKNTSVIPGEVVFKLYDTYGFPTTLLSDIVKKDGFTIDLDGYNIELEKQRNRARNARSNESSMEKQSDVLTSIKVVSEYVGEKELECVAKVVAIATKDAICEKLVKDDIAYVILDKTPFYAEGGGQVADVGQIVSQKGTIELLDVQKAPNGQHLHKVKVIDGELKVNDSVTASVTSNIHVDTKVNHSATHLLHQALKDVLGNHVTQSGSFVDNNSLRFDFSHFDAVTKEQLTEIENIVNDMIKKQLVVKVENMSIDDAKEAGAIATFTEKYGDTVRTVFMGDYSKELCGGSHVNNTSEIVLFKIVKESGVAAGSRRIEALAGNSAIEYLKQKEQKLELLAEKMQTNVANVFEKLDSLLKLNSDLALENKELKSRIAKDEFNNLEKDISLVGEIPLLLKKVENIDNSELRNIIDTIKSKNDSVAVVIANVVDTKITFVAGVTKDLIGKGVKAGDLVKTVAVICNGNGGGRPDFAQAGGKDATKIDMAFEQLQKDILKKFSN